MSVLGLDQLLPAELFCLAAVADVGLAVLRLLCAIDRISEWLDQLSGL
ncbi:hypothetical protein ABH924_003337 [Arthrobacter sp. GAS37]